MGIPIKTHDDFSTTEEADLIIDGLIGYSLKGPPYGGAALLIQWANSQPAPILSLDVPSGIDTTSGNIYDPAIKADATMTLALPKQSFLNPEVMLKSGELYLADISVPPQLYNHPPLNLKVTNIFTQSDIVRIYPEG